MKVFEIMFHDLNEEAQAELLKEYGTTAEEENWDVYPLAVIEREDEA